MNLKNTLVIGASENPERYSNKAIRRLNQHKHPVFAIGNKIGEADGIELLPFYSVKKQFQYGLFRSKYFYKKLSKNTHFLRQI